MTITCINRCGLAVTGSGEANEAEQVELLGWKELPVGRGWRCPACCEVMTTASNSAGTGTGYSDDIPADELGALKQPVKGTIVPPVVKP